MRGFILLPVVMTLSLIATVAYWVNRENGMQSARFNNLAHTDRARYAAEAGLQAANARMQSRNCGNDYPVLSTPVTNNNFAGASYTAYASANSGTVVTLTSVGTYKGTSVTLTRANSYAYPNSNQNYTLQPNATGGIDTFVSTNSGNNNGASTQMAVSANNFPLLRFDLAPLFPSGSFPESMVLTTRIDGSFGVAFYDAYRMDASWVEGSGLADGATWYTSNGVTAWAPLGGSYHTTRLANGGAFADDNLDIDLTPMGFAWMTGRYANNGLRLVRSGSFGGLNMILSENSEDSKRPKLTFSYRSPCGTTGP